MLNVKRRQTTMDLVWKEAAWWQKTGRKRLSGAEQGHEGVPGCYTRPARLLPRQAVNWCTTGAVSGSVAEASNLDWMAAQAGGIYVLAFAGEVGIGRGVGVQLRDRASKSGAYSPSPSHRAAAPPALIRCPRRRAEQPGCAVV